MSQYQRLNSFLEQLKRYNKVSLNSIESETEPKELNSTIDELLEFFQGETLVERRREEDFTSEGTSTDLVFSSFSGEEDQELLTKWRQQLEPEAHKWNEAKEKKEEEEEEEEKEKEEEEKEGEETNNAFIQRLKKKYLKEEFAVGGVAECEWNEELSIDAEKEGPEEPEDEVLAMLLKRKERLKLEMG